MTWGDLKKLATEDEWSDSAVLRIQSVDLENVVDKCKNLSDREIVYIKKRGYSNMKYEVILIAAESYK